MNVRFCRGKENFPAPDSGDLPKPVKSLTDLQWKTFFVFLLRILGLSLQKFFPDDKSTTD